MSQYVTNLISDVDYQGGSTEPGVSIKTNEPLTLEVNDELHDKGNKYIIRRRVKFNVGGRVETVYTYDQ